MPRSDAQTAFGGLMLGMALPLGALSAELLFDSKDLLGLSPGVFGGSFGALLSLAALCLGCAGATLLWAERLAFTRPEPLVVAVARPAPAPAALFKLQPKARKVSRPPRRSTVGTYSATPILRPRSKTPTVVLPSLLSPPSRPLSLSRR